MLKVCHVAPTKRIGPSQILNSCSLKYYFFFLKYYFVKKYSLFAFLCSFFCFLWKGLFFIKTRRPNLEEGCQTHFGEIGRVETATEDQLEHSPTIIGDLCERDAGWVSPGPFGVSASCTAWSALGYSRSVKTVLLKGRLPNWLHCRLSCLESQRSQSAVITRT